MNVLQSIRKKKAFKVIALYLAFSMLVELLAPMRAFALTSGPAQEEFASFEPVSTSNMVDVYTGDFTYNIPLLSVPGPNGGYPINLAYHSGIGMEQEASWVGLGWNLNVGAINRQLRGLPDDFNGDAVTQTTTMKQDWTVGLDMNTKIDKNFGMPVASPPAVSWQVYYNRYRGMGVRANYSFKKNPEGRVAVGLSYDSQGGFGVEPNLSFESNFFKSEQTYKLGTSINSRRGLQAVSFSMQLQAEKTHMIRKKTEDGKNNKDGGDAEDAGKSGIGFSGSSSVSFGFSQSTPGVSLRTINRSFPFNISDGAANSYGSDYAEFPDAWSGYVTYSNVEDDGISINNAFGYYYDRKATADDMRDFQRDNIPYSRKVPNLAPSSFTYDTYAQSGQGSGGQFRPYRNEIPLLSDKTIKSINREYNITLEYGDAVSIATPPTITSPSYFHIAPGFSLGSGSSQSGSWYPTDNLASPSSVSDIAFEDDLTLLSSVNAAGDPAYEPVHTRIYGEKSGELLDDDLLGMWGGDEALRPVLEKKDNKGGWINRYFKAENDFIRHSGDNTPVTTTPGGTNTSYKQRKRRATNVEYLNAGEAAEYGLTQKTGYDPVTSMGVTTWNPISKSFSSPSGHFSEITMLQPDGMRYVYGLPAYNKHQDDLNFSVNMVYDYYSITASVPASGSDPDVSGTYDGFFSKRELPAYAHSWLLTAVVSADYVDLTNNGPTDDDLGYWIKFNYALKTGADAYQWRVPYSYANHLRGNKDNPNDNKGSVTRGRKEHYYLESIESKTHIAVFSLSRREDAIAADNDFDGGMPANVSHDSTRMFKLDKVALYSKREFFSSGTTLRNNPVPLHVVNFRYSYNLCPNVPNNTGVSVDVNGASVAMPADPDNVNIKKGKLTLDKLFFTNETSTRGELSPYVFDYGDISNATGEDNPDYDPRNIDRWGNFKNNDAYTGVPLNTYPFFDFPYTNQETMPDADAWSLQEIHLPSGSTLAIEYESDDYQYVEDQKAMHMYDIVGFEETGTGPVFKASRNTDPTTNAVDVHNPMSTNDEYRYYFKLETPIAVADAYPDSVKIKYLNNGALSKVFYRSEMNLKNASNPHYEYISGYAEISYGSGDFGYASTTGSLTTRNVAFITLKGEPISEFNYTGMKINPMVKAAIQHLHYNSPENAFTVMPQTNDPASQIVNLASSVWTFTNDIASMFADYNVWAYAKQLGRDMHMNGRSVFRLCDEDNRMYGGGVRVASLKLSGSWVNGSSTDNFEYGQKYAYTLEDGSSSGVAYEPQTGGEECALRNPVNYVNSTPLIGKEKLFVEKPLMESCYPGPSVGYSRVVVKSIAPDKANAEDGANNLLNGAAPITVYEFYTPKDFPVIFDQTDLSSDPSIIRPIMIPGIYSSFKKRMARSQGYSVILNDMAGKAKSISQFTRSFPSAPGQTLISKQEFIYETAKPYNPGIVNKLSSRVQVLVAQTDMSGVPQPYYQTGIIGESYDMHIDLMENRELNKTRGGIVNLELTIPSPPFFIMPLPNISKHEASLRTVVMNKIIHRTGILKETVTQAGESIIRTQNLAYDIETGQPVLVKVTNEFKDELYSFSYPGHWYYAAMQGAYKNSQLVINGIPSPIPVGSDGRIDIAGYIPSGKKAIDYFTVGDEVWVDYASSSTEGRFTVIKVGEASGGTVQFIDLIDEDGALISNSGSPTLSSIKIIRSGHKNIQTAIVGSLGLHENGSATVGAFVAYDPNDLGATEKNSPVQMWTSDLPTDVLNASAVEFSDIWQTTCANCEENGIEPTDIINPYRKGVRGQWRPLRSYAFNTTRTQADNIRTDGIYTTFTPFNWIDPSSNVSEWTSASTITKYSPYSFELENKDAIGNYSSALYEYDNALVTAVAANARYKEIAFDAFEDYVYPNDCRAADHWGLLSSIDTSSAQHHTGRYSLKLNNNTTSSITRPLWNKNCETFAAAKRSAVIVEEDPSEEFVMDTCDCLGRFSPVRDKKYVLSAWVKEITASAPGTTYTSPEIEVKITNSSNVQIALYTFNPSGKIIEGWQRVFESFDVPAAAANIIVTMRNTASGSSTDYFDDIRIHPFDANMATYVYDPVNLKLVAELDANNYATFYIYDSEGKLSKVKKETIEGIKTIQEGRSSTVQQ